MTKRHPTDLRYEALVQARVLEQSLLLDEQPENSQEIELNLLGFCMAKLGRRHQPLDALPGAPIEELLNHNDLHYRRVKPPRYPQEGEFPVMIVFQPGIDHPFALYREGRSAWLYNPKDQSHQQVTAGTVLTGDAYEVYLPLPPKVGGPVSILRFTFQTEIASLVALLITSAIVMMFNLSIPLLTNMLVSRILPQNDEELLIQGFSVVVLIAMGSTASQYLQNLMMLRLESVADLRLQSAVWDRVMRLPMSFISKYTTGDLASRVGSINQLRQLVGSGVFSTLLSSLFALSYFVLMFRYDVQLSLWATAFTVVGVLCLVGIIYKSIRLQTPLLESGAEITNFSLQAVMGLPQIRSAGAEPFVLLRWLREVNRYGLLQLKANIYADAIEQYGILVSPISCLFLFAVVTYRLLNAQDGAQLNAVIVAFVSFNAAFSGFNSAVTGAVNLIASVAGRAAVLWQRAEPVMYADVERGYQPDAIRHSVHGEFYFRRIAYEFPDSSEPLFQGLSFMIPAGKHTAITGASGCGKTTLVRMLLGFVNPVSGELLVDGIPLSQLSIRFYRRQLGVVMQTARLNAGSIYDVICGGVQRSEAEVWEALECAAVAEEIRSMPMQLETLLSDSGGNVSGGQVQRIAIARALITKPKVLIMDEATSALDNNSQQIITNTINELGITRISIAHRLATIKESDQIIILTKGQQAEAGTWDTLCDHGYLRHMIASR